MPEYIKDWLTDFDAKNFVNEPANASKNPGIIETKIDSYQFMGILIPMLQKKIFFQKKIADKGNERVYAV